MVKYFSRLATKIKKIIFGYVTPPCIGIDISSTAIKMVELAPNSLNINRYSIVSLPRNLVSEGVINDIERVSEIIKNQWDNLHSSYSEVAIAVPYNAVVLREISAPIFNSKYELDAYVKSQLVKDLDNEDIDFDFTIKTENKEDQALSVAVAKKEKIEEYQAIVQMTGMSVAAIDIEPFAIQSLFEILLNKIHSDEHIILLELAATRMRAFIFLNKQLIIFNEINVNYYPLLEELVTQIENPPVLTKDFNIYEYVINLINNNKLASTELINTIVSDVTKLLQLVKSSMLVEKKISLSDSAEVFIMGGNAIIKGIAENLSHLFTKKVNLATDLLPLTNKNIPQTDLVRLFTAIALATWGQHIGKN